MDQNSIRAEKKNDEGKSLYQRKEYREAILVFDQAIKLKGNVAEYWKNRAECYIKIRNYYKALNDAQKSINIDENFIDGYKCLSQCHKMLDDLYYSLKYIQNAQDLDPSDKTISIEIENVKKLLELQNEATELFEQNNYKTAINIINKYLEIIHDSKNFILLKVQCLIFLQKFDKAAVEINSILSKMPHDEDVLYVKGLNDYYKDYITITFEDLQNIKKFIPDHIEMAKLYKKAKDTLNFLHYVNETKDNEDKNDAYVFLTEAYKVDPKNYITNQRLLRQKIDIALKCEELNCKIINDCTKYLNTFDQNIDVLKIRAQQYFKIQEYQDAKDDYVLILKLQNSLENSEKCKEVDQLLTDQLSNNFKILKIKINETNVVKIKKAYEALNTKYNDDLKKESDESKQEKIKLKIDRIEKAYKVITDELSSVIEVTKKYSILQKAKKCIDQQEFTQANELLDEISSIDIENEDTLYTKSRLEFYENYILKSYDSIKKIYDKVQSDKIKGLYEKASKTYNLIKSAEESVANNKFVEGYKYLTDALKIDKENTVTNKEIYLSKINMGLKYSELKNYLYKDCSLYIAEFGRELSILKIRAKYSLENLEFEDAMEDFKDIYELEETEENKNNYENTKKLFEEEKEDIYKILRINKNVKDSEQIRAAFKRLLLFYHPDKNPWVTEERKKKLEKKLIRLKDAYEDIKNKLGLRI